MCFAPPVPGTARSEAGLCQERALRSPPRIRGGSPRSDGRTWKEGASASPWRAPGWQVGRAARARRSALAGAAARGLFPRPPPLPRPFLPGNRIYTADSWRRLPKYTFAALRPGLALAPRRPSLGGGWTPPAGEAELRQGFSWATELSTAEVLELQPRRALASRPPGSRLHALRGSAPSFPRGLRNRPLEMREGSNSLLSKNFRFLGAKD